MTIKEVAEIISAFGTLILGVIVAYIAWRQHKTDRNKLKLDLYDRRLKLYEAAMDFIAGVVRNGNAEDVALIEFLKSVRESRFLFSKEVEKYFTQLYTRGVDLQYSNKVTSDPGVPVGEERTEAAREHADIFKWFAKQFEELKERLTPYMGFDA